jgi:ABC-type maltose transport system permease subunit
VSLLIPCKLLLIIDLYEVPPRLRLLSSFQNEMAQLNVTAGWRDSVETSFNEASACDGCSRRDALSRLSFALGALMLHVAKPFDQVVRTG